jgi:hypothetical protein
MSTGSPELAPVNYNLAEPIERGPCEADAYNLVLLFLKRRGLRILRAIDYNLQKNITVSDGMEEALIQVYSKGGIVVGGGDTRLRSILKQFETAVQTSPAKTAIDAAKNALQPHFAERLAALEVAVDRLHQAKKKSLLTPSDPAKKSA